jgi:hypothetical protein
MLWLYMPAAVVHQKVIPEIRSFYLLSENNPAYLL